MTSQLYKNLTTIANRAFRHFERSEKSSEAYNFFMPKNYYVYIITNYTNSVFYTGITNNLKRRIWEHKEGIANNSFSKKYKLYKLIWFQEFLSPNEAIVVEKKVKDFRREKKLILIKKLNPTFKDLMTFY